MWRASVCALGALAAAVTLLLAAGAAVADSHTVPLTIHTAHTCTNCPAAPAGTAEPGPGAGEITLRWTWSQGTKPAVANWTVLCFAGSGNPQHNRVNLGAGTRKHTCKNLKPGVQYSARVNGFSAANFSTSVMAAELLPENQLKPDAGEDATVRAGARVELDGSGSWTARRGATLTYAWRQTGGPTVGLAGATLEKAGFTAPRVSSQKNLTFELTVDDGTSSETDTVTVTVLPSRVASAKVDGDELSVTFDTALKTSARPASSAFTVTASGGGASRTIAGTSSLVTISDKTVTATLSAAVAGDEKLRVRYDKPASGAVLEDGTGTALPSFSNWPAGNAGDTTPPRVSSARRSTGRTLTLTFNEALLTRELGAADRPDGHQGRLCSWCAAASINRTRRQGGRFGIDVAPELGGGGGRTAMTVTVTYSASLTGDGGHQRVCGTCRANDVRQFLTTPAAPVTNNTPPAFSSAAVVGDALTVTFDGELDSGSVPAADAFTVTVGGAEVELAAANPVSISGTAVTLNLAEAVLRVQTVTVGYTAPAVKPLRDADGANNPVPGFTGKAVTNDTPADTTPPRVSGKAVNGTTLTVTFNEALLESSNGIPDANRFGVGVAGTLTTVSNVDVSGSTLTLTLGAAAAHGDDVTVTYSHPQGDTCTRCLQDLSGSKVRQFRTTPAAPVTNNTPPAFSSAAVNGDALTVTFEGALDPGSVPAADAFTVTVGGAEVELAATNPVSISGAEVTLKLAEAVLRVQTVDGGLRGAGGEPAAGRGQRESRWRASRARR